MNKFDRELVVELKDKWEKREEHIEKEIGKLAGWEEETRLKIARGKETDLVKEQFKHHAHWTQELGTREKQKWRMAREAVKDLEMILNA